MFDGMSELYQALWNQMCASLVESVIEGDCATALHQYNKLPWLAPFEKNAPLVPRQVFFVILYF